MRVGGFALPAGSLDSALLVTLSPGVYTVQLTGENPGGLQNAMIEVYWVPPAE